MWAGAKNREGRVQRSCFLRSLMLQLAWFPVNAYPSFNQQILCMSLFTGQNLNLCRKSNYISCDYAHWKHAVLPIIWSIFSHSLFTSHLHAIIFQTWKLSATLHIQYIFNYGRLSRCLIKSAVWGKKMKQKNFCVKAAADWTSSTSDSSNSNNTSSLILHHQWDVTGPTRGLLKWQGGCGKNIAESCYTPKEYTEG